MDEKEIKSKRMPLYQGGAKWIFGAVYELVRSVLKPDIKLTLSIENTPTLYSIASETDDKKYLLLTIKCKRKTLGNIVLQAVGYFYNDNTRTNHPLPLVFEKPPEVLEADEEANLKCLTDINFKNAIHSGSKIVIKVTFDYAFISNIKSINKTFSWKLSTENGIPFLNSDSF